MILIGRDFGVCRPQECPSYINIRSLNNPTMLRAKMEEDDIIVTGIKTGYTIQTDHSDLPRRLPWNEFVKTTENLTLYVLALRRLQSRAEDQIDSFFRIGGSSSRSSDMLKTGIHGLPYEQWGTAAGDNPVTGYCHHGSLSPERTPFNRSGDFPNLAPPLRRPLRTMPRSSIREHSSQNQRRKPQRSIQKTCRDLATSLLGLGRGYTNSIGVD